MFEKFNPESVNHLKGYGTLLIPKCLLAKDRLCALKEKSGAERLQGGAVFMSTGWPPFRYRFSTTLQSGTVFYQKKVDYGSTTLVRGTVFFLKHDY